MKELIIEYTKFLNRNLDFQGLEEELKDLKSKYTGNEGEVLVALSDDNIVMGCVAYHRLNDSSCEMKRLFVKPDFRKLKLGEKLISEIIKHAKNKNYKVMFLDTIEPLKAAIHLYKNLGLLNANHITTIR